MVEEGALSEIALIGPVAGDSGGAAAGIRLRPSSKPLCSQNLCRIAIRNATCRSEVDGVI
jgi:hypothetical protein